MKTTYKVTLTITIKKIEYIEARTKVKALEKAYAEVYEGCDLNGCDLNEYSEISLDNMEAVEIKNK